MGVPKRKKQIKRFATRALHAGYTRGTRDASLAEPLYQGVAHYFSDTRAANEIFTGKRQGFVYGRINNPTCDTFERRMAELEGGEAALGTSSGMAAIFMTAVAFCRQGDEIVSSDRVYGGTFHLFAETLPRFGIRVRWVKNPNDPFSWKSALSKKTKFLFVETPSNPVVDIFDIESIAHIAHKHRIPLVVDSTVASPALQRPLEWGADVVVHSATKYIAGNATSLGGVIIGKAPLIDGLRAGAYRDIGPSLAPMNAWLFILGLQTLAVRMELHSNNAQQLAEFLSAHPAVARVYYPNIEQSPYRALIERQMGGRGSALMGFELKGGKRVCTRFIESLTLITHAAHLGDVRSLAIHPASTTHEQLSSAERKKAHISDTLIRMSVGLEDIHDIISDIRNALNHAKKA